MVIRNPTLYKTPLYTRNCSSSSNSSPPSSPSNRGSSSSPTRFLIRCIVASFGFSGYTRHVVHLLLQLASDSLPPSPREEEVSQNQFHYKVKFLHPSIFFSMVNSMQAQSQVFFIYFWNSQYQNMPLCYSSLYIHFHSFTRFITSISYRYWILVNLFKLCV